MKKKVTLIDAIYINNSGGKVLLDYLIEEIIALGKQNDFYFLLDQRGKYEYLDKISYSLIAGSERKRKKYYKSFVYGKVFCFANVPPPVRVDSLVYTYFHNALLATSVNNYPTKTKLLKYIKRLYIKYRSSNTDFFIVQTNSIKRLVESNISSKKKTFVYPFYKPYERVLEKDKNNNEFVYISNGNPHKNHGILLDAWKELSLQGFYPKLNLTVTKDYPKIIERIESLIKEGVNLKNHGFTDVKRLFEKSLYLIYPSLIESFGLGLVEGANYGLKIIVSDLDYVKDVVKPSFTFDPNDKNSIVDVVKKCIMKHNIPESTIVVENKVDKLIELIIN